MTINEVKKQMTCICGGEFHYDGYESVGIEDGFLVIKGDCYCNMCRKHIEYEELHRVNFNEPYDITLEEPYE